jgi:hypothetical protein
MYRAVGPIRNDPGVAGIRNRSGRRARADTKTTLLVTSGMVELAAGATSGWVYTLVRTRPDLASRLGIRSGARIRQWHLDLAMLGTATVASGLAIPDPPRIPATALGIGAWTNAMAFLPLAFHPDLDRHPAYRAYAGASFVLTTVGFVGMAADAVRRRGAR